MSKGYFHDGDFQTHILKFLCRDRQFLKECAPILDHNDFKPKKGEGTEIWQVATAALDFWHKYREPIGGLLRSEMLDFARRNKWGEKQKAKLTDLVYEVSKGQNLVAVDALVDKILDYKRSQAMKRSVNEIIEMQEKGELTQEKFSELCRKGIEAFSKLGYSIVDYFESLEKRELRRQLASHHRFPYLMIDPLDEAIRAIGRKHLGLLLAPYKKGKSLGLRHIAVAYLQQGYNVIFVTLEDPLEQVEDGFDSMLSALPIKRLHELPRKLRKKFSRFKRMWKARLKIIDGTEGGMSIDKLEEIWENERNRGFTADVVIVDYDDEIAPPRKYPGENARRMEFADIYRSFRRFVAKRDIIGWTAAQTRRVKENKKIIAGEDTAEDISKIRKVTLAIGIGQGDWGENSYYIFIAAHKFDKGHIGWNIMSDRDRGMFYDPDATRRARAKELRLAKKEKKV
jgi:hypothetical protein